MVLYIRSSKLAISNIFSLSIVISSYNGIFSNPESICVFSFSLIRSGPRIMMLVSCDDVAAQFTLQQDSQFNRCWVLCNLSRGNSYCFLIVFFSERKLDLTQSTDERHGGYVWQVERIFLIKVTLYSRCNVEVNRTS